MCLYPGLTLEFMSPVQSIGDFAAPSVKAAGSLEVALKLRVCPSRAGQVWSRLSELT